MTKSGTVLISKSIIRKEYNLQKSAAKEQKVCCQTFAPLVVTFRPLSAVFGRCRLFGTCKSRHLEKQRSFHWQGFSVFDVTFVVGNFSTPAKVGMKSLTVDFSDPLVPTILPIMLTFQDTNLISFCADFCQC